MTNRSIPEPQARSSEQSPPPCEGVHQRSPEFAYEYVHHIPVVTKEVVAFLTEPMEFHLCVARARVYGVR